MRSILRAAEADDIHGITQATTGAIRSIRAHARRITFGAQFAGQCRSRACVRHGSQRHAMGTAATAGAAGRRDLGFSGLFLQLRRRHRRHRLTLAVAAGDKKRQRILHRERLILMLDKDTPFDQAHHVTLG